uniref:Retrovirus-related Pol polyprotein from transposon TNT 1-94-like beta-barrel domain-containing protein n=1 Tax=Tanacetum cinerariifolium TaxID=118510 RepID=A0A699GM90_TANCI|nr:hypothetical protein [Tanacetum cinerariifolium]
MALSNEHLLTLSQYKDAKTLFEAIKARFGGNDATKKTQKTLSKQMYENFNAPSTKSLDLRIVSDSDEDESEEMVLKYNNVQHKPEQANQPRKVSQNPRNNRTNWNEMRTQKLGVGYQFTKKACFVCGSFSHLIKHCDFHDKMMVQKPVLKNVEKETSQREVRPVWNNTIRINHQNLFNCKRNFAPIVVLTKSGIVPISTARQSSSKAATPVSAARPINTATPKPLVNVAKPRQNALQKSHSLSRRPFYQQTTLKNRILNNKINSAKANSVNTAKENRVTGAVMKQWINVVKSSACWVWRPKINVQDHVFKNSGSYICDPQDALKDQGYFDSGCSRHMTGNISYLTYFKEHDGGYVAFGGGAKGGKITSKGTIRTGIKREYSVAGTPQQNRVAERRNRTLIEATRTMVADFKLPTTFWAEEVNISCYVQNRVLVVKPHFMTPYELFKGGGPEWLFDIDALSESINYALVPAGTNSNDFAGKGASFDAERPNAESNTKNVNTARPSINIVNASDNTGSLNINTVSLPINTATLTYADYPVDHLMPYLEDTGIFNDDYDDRDEGVKVDYNNLETVISVISVSPIPSTRVHKDHRKEQILSEMEPKKVKQALDDESWVEAMQEELFQFKLLNVWTLVDLPYGKRAIGTKWVFKNKRDQRRIVVRNKAKLIKNNILLVQVYVDDIIFGSTKKSLSTEFEQLLHKRYQMSSMRELTFFLGLQSASTPMETCKPLSKDANGTDVDVHLYRFQVQPKVSHTHAIKKIFRYLKGQPTLGLWYPKDSPLELIVYSDSDYAGASLDRKSTTRGCQFLSSMLISWQCKKQTITDNTTTEAEYIAASNCCG